MAAAANYCRVELGRLDIGGIVRVLGLRSMTRFAWNYHVLAQFLLVDDVGVTAFADLVPRMRDRTCGNFGDGVGPVVPVSPKALRHHCRPKNYECHHADH